MGKCPKCEGMVNRLVLHGVEAAAPFSSTSWKAITFNCPHCSTVLSAAIDPIAVKTDIVKEVLRGLGKTTR